MAGEGAPLSPRTMAGNMAMKQAREDLEEGRAEDAEMSLLAAISFFEEAGNEELLGQASEMLEYVQEVMRENHVDEEEDNNDELMASDDSMELDRVNSPPTSPKAVMSNDFTNAIKAFIQNRNEAESKSLLSNMKETSAVKERDADASAEPSSYTRELLLVMVCMLRDCREQLESFMEQTQIARDPSGLTSTYHGIRQYGSRTADKLLAEHRTELLEGEINSLRRERISLLEKLESVSVLREQVKYLETSLGSMRAEKATIENQKLRYEHLTSVIATRIRVDLEDLGRCLQEHRSKNPQLLSELQQAIRFAYSVEKAQALEQIEGDACEHWLLTANAIINKAVSFALSVSTCPQTSSVATQVDGGETHECESKSGRVSNVEEDKATLKEARAKIDNLIAEVVDFNTREMIFSQQLEKEQHEKTVLADALADLETRMRRMNDRMREMKAENERIQQEQEKCRKKSDAAIRTLHHVRWLMLNRMIPEEMSKAIIRHVEQLEHDEDYFQLDEQSWDVVRVCGLLIHFLCRRRDESCLSPDDNLAQLNRQSLQDKTSCTSVITFEAAEKILQGVKEFADDLKKREKLRRQILFDLKVNFDKERNQLESVIRLKEQQLVSRDDVKQRKKLDVGKNIDKIYKSLLENSGQSPRSSQGELGSPRPATRPASDDRISLSPRELESLLTPRRRILEALDKAGASPALVTQVVTAMDRAEKEAVSRGRSPRESYRTSTLRGQEAAGLRLTDDS